MSDYPILSDTPGRRDTALAPASLGTAGQRQRVNAGATAPEWSDPDLVCTAAELATTYAPSAVLRGVVAYTSDTLATYVCRRTAASTYSWAQVGGGASYAVSTKTSNYTASAGDVLLCDAATGAFAITLPPAGDVASASITVKKIDATASAVTIAPDGVETIDGAPTLDLSTQNEAVTLWSDGSNWWVT